MRVGNLPSSSVPEDIQVFTQELHGEGNLHILEIHIDGRVLERVSGRSLRDHQLPILEGHLLDVLRHQFHRVSNVDLLLDGLETESCGIVLLIGVILHDDPHGPHPSNLRTTRVRDKLGIHDHFLVGNEVERESMFPLDGVAEETSSREDDAEMRIISASCDLVILDGDGDGGGVICNLASVAASGEKDLEGLNAFKDPIVNELHWNVFQDCVTVKGQGANVTHKVGTQTWEGKGCGLVRGRSGRSYVANQ